MIYMKQLGKDNAYLIYCSLVYLQFIYRSKVY